MHVRALASWKEFEPAMSELYADYAGRELYAPHLSSLLLRGQGNSTWRLETTLDRASNTPLGLTDYYKIVCDISPKLQTLLSQRWELPTVTEYSAWASSISQMPQGPFLAESYLAYLRHHGFPSPLLDWTRSPYVAAFFAFRHPEKGATHVSIYAFLEWALGHKAASAGEPEIRGIGPRSIVHRRHIMQQSEYTVCFRAINDAATYARHEDAFALDRSEQDLLWRFDIPVGERTNALIQLNRMNLGAFSLLGSEDALLEELALSAFELGPK